MRKYCKEKVKKVSKNNHRAGTTQCGAPISNRARADRIFLTTLSPREFRRATEASSIYRDLSKNSVSSQIGQNNTTCLSRAVKLA